jgi:surface protein
MKGSSGYSPVSKTDDDDDGHDTITRLEAGETTGRARPPGAAVASDEEAMDEDFVTLRRNRPTTVVVVALAILFAILLIAAVHTFGFPGTPGSDGLLAPLPSHPGDSTMSGQDEPQAIGGSTSNPAVVPHYTWDGKKCFVDNAELREAVDSYLLNKSNDTLEAVYGLPIGRWCVRYVESFSLVFASQGRNFTYPDRADNLTVLMERFNDDITGWDVTGAKDLDRMFRGAKNFNQDLSGWDVSRVESMLGTFEMTNRFDGGTSTVSVLLRHCMKSLALAFG